jgi:hypothetical protein
MPVDVLVGLVELKSAKAQGHEEGRSHVLL